MAEISRIRGKTALAEYWGRALANAADLRFELQAAYVGSDALTVAYTNHRGRWASETFVFGADGLVIESIATILGRGRIIEGAPTLTPRLSEQWR